MWGSSGLGVAVGVTSEGTVGDIGAVVEHEGHDRLVHRTIPLNEAWFTESVPIDVLVVLVVSRLLKQSPLEMRISDRRVLGNHAAHIPPKEVWVVHQRLQVDVVVVVDDGSLLEETSSDASTNHILDIEEANECSCVKALNWQFTHDK